MRRFVDLHTHSTASDGALPPEELVRLADARRLAALALTDHDTTAGLAAARKAAKQFPSLRFIPGVEVSAAFPRGTLHILGLNIDEHSKPLQAMLQKLRALRDERNPKILERLRDLGLEICMEDVLAAARRRAAGSVISRLHMAEALRRKGYVRTTKEAFDRYIGDEGSAYVEKDRMPPREIIAAIRAAGGVAALAHPPQLNYSNNAQLERMLRDLIGQGLSGLEVYHSEHSDTQTRLYLKLAHRFKLEVCGGSDFHGAAKSHVYLGRPRVPAAALTGQLAELLA